MLVIPGWRRVWSIGVIGDEWLPFAPDARRGGWGEGLLWRRTLGGRGRFAVKRGHRGRVSFLERPRPAPRRRT